MKKKTHEEMLEIVLKALVNHHVAGVKREGLPLCLEALDAIDVLGRKYNY